MNPTPTSLSPSKHFKTKTKQPRLRLCVRKQLSFQLLDLDRSVASAFGREKEIKFRTSIHNCGFSFFFLVQRFSLV